MSEACYHCGEDIPAGFDARLSVHGQARRFCCVGCMAIAEMLVSHKLDNFYQHRSALSQKPDALSSRQEAEIRLYDEAEMQNQFVEEQADGSRVAALNIQGITCAACIWLLEREVSNLPGVLSFSVHHGSHKGHLVWRQEAQPLSAILLLLRKLGFTATPYQEDLATKAMQQERRVALYRMAVAGIAMMQSMMFSVPLYMSVYTGIDENFLNLFRWVSLIVCLPVVLFSSKPFFRAALRDWQTRNLTMDVPISLAIILAFISSALITVFTEPSLDTEVYFDSITMFVFLLLLGRFVEMNTRHKHLNSDAEMQRLVPTSAVILDPQNGAERTVPAHRLKAGDHVVVRQGELVAVDGVVVEGHSHIDESALTGEYLPLAKHPGDTVHAGTANVENTLVVEAQCTVSQSRVAAIVRLLDRAQAEKPSTVMAADKVASLFVLGVLISTVASGLYWYFEAPNKALMIMVAVLIATCPCALGLATPTALTAANTALRRLGFIVTRGHTLEALSQTTDLIFDKTGTLTEGRLHLEGVDLYAELTEPEVLALCAALEQESRHPIAQTFTPFRDALSASNIQNIVGQGVQGEINGVNYRLGTFEFVCVPGLERPKNNDAFNGVQVWLADTQRILARVCLSDQLRSNAAESIQQLRQLGLRVHILSGDNAGSVQATAQRLGVEHYLAGQSPEQKLSYVRELQERGAKVAMVGDGINDLPVLTGAQLSIAMGNASDLAKMNSDAVLLNSHLEVLTQSFIGARRTYAIIKQNIFWAILYNASMLPAAAAGMVPPWIAAVGMSLSSLLVLFNSLRLRSIASPQSAVLRPQLEVN